MQRHLLTDIHFATYLKRSEKLRKTIIGLFLWLTAWPRLFVAIFLRRGMGSRYFSVLGCLVLAAALVWIPQWYHFHIRPILYTVEIDSYTQAAQYVPIEQAKDFPLFNLKFGAGYYILIAVFLFFANQRLSESTLPAGVFDPNKHSYSKGAMWSWMFAPRLPQIRFNRLEDGRKEYALNLPYPRLFFRPFRVQILWRKGWLSFFRLSVSSRTAEVFVEPMTFFALSLLAYPLNFLLMLFFNQSCYPEVLALFTGWCAVLYGVGQWLAYWDGDNAIRDKLDENIEKSQQMDALHGGGLTDAERKDALVKGRWMSPSIEKVLERHTNVPSFKAT